MSERLRARSALDGMRRVLSASGATLRNLRVINSHLLPKEPSRSSSEAGILRSVLSAEAALDRSGRCGGSVPEPSPEPSPMINAPIRRRGRKHVGHPSQWFNPPVITVRTHKIDLSGVHFFRSVTGTADTGTLLVHSNRRTVPTHVVIPGFSISGCDVLRAAKGRSHTTRPAGGQAYLQGTLLLRQAQPPLPKYLSPST